MHTGEVSYGFQPVRQVTVQTLSRVIGLKSALTPRPDFDESRITLPLTAHLQHGPAASCRI